MIGSIIRAITKEADRDSQMVFPAITFTEKEEKLNSEFIRVRACTIPCADIGINETTIAAF
jgi:hypothetical protein